jgi:hypothetical protein
MYKFVADPWPIGSKTRIQRPVAKRIVFRRLQKKCLWRKFFLLAGNEKKNVISTPGKCTLEEIIYTCTCIACD